MFERLFQNRLVRNGALYTGFSFLNKGVSFVLLLWVANRVGPEEYGLLNLFMVLVTALVFVIPLGTEGIVLMGYFRYKPTRYKQLFGASMLVSLVVFGVLCLALLLGGGGLARISGLGQTYLWWALVVALFTVAGNYYSNWCRTTERVVSYGVFNSVGSFGDALLSVVFIGLMAMGWQGRIVAQVVCTGVLAGVVLLFLWPKGVLAWRIPSKISLRETLGYGVPLLPHNMANWLRFGVDRYVISYFFATSVVGYYGFAFTLSLIVSTAGLAINLANSVNTYKELERSGDKARALMRRQTRIITAGYIVLSGAVVGGAWYVVPAWFGTYVDSLPFVLPLTLAAAMQSISLLYIHYLHYRKQTRLIMYITLSTACIHLVLSIWLTRFSPLYTAWLYAISSAVVTLLMYRYSKKSIKTK